MAGASLQESFGTSAHEAYMADDTVERISIADGGLVVIDLGCQ